MKMKSIRNFFAFVVFLAVAAIANNISAQAPPCSNKWMEIGPNVLSPGPLVEVGRHKIWVGRKNKKTGMIENWISYGPFKMAGGTKYLLRFESNGIAGPTANDVALGRYSNPTRDRATIFYQNKAGNGIWVAACTQYMGT